MDATLQVEHKWSVWRRTFLILPKQDINDKYIIGPAWIRMVETCIMEYEDNVGYIVASYGDHTEYARSKKDIFVKNLKDKKVDK